MGDDIGSGSVTDRRLWPSVYLFAPPTWVAQLSEFILLPVSMSYPLITQLNQHIKNIVL